MISNSLDMEGLEIEDPIAELAALEEEIHP